MGDARRFAASNCRTFARYRFSAGEVQAASRRSARSPENRSLLLTRPGMGLHRIPPRGFQCVESDRGAGIRVRTAGWGYKLGPL